jgi:hypothetical protein
MKKFLTKYIEQLVQRFLDGLENFLNYESTTCQLVLEYMKKFLTYYLVGMNNLSTCSWTIWKSFWKKSTTSWQLVLEYMKKFLTYYLVGMNNLSTCSWTIWKSFWKKSTTSWQLVQRFLDGLEKVFEKSQQLLDNLFSSTWDNLYKGSWMDLKTFSTIT